jgi:colanic acid biosynthesis glycosyl transferase WcaI
MNFLLINQYYPPDTAPTGHYLHDVARVLVQRGHSVTVFCSQRAYNGQESYPLAEDRDGVFICRVKASGFGRMSGLGKLLDYASFYLTLMGRLLSSSCRPDVILALTTPPHLGLLTAWAARRKKCAHAHWVMDVYPDVLVAHGSCTPRSPLYRLLGWLTKRELRDAPLVFCLGDDMAERIGRYMPEALRRSALVSLPLWCEPTVFPWSESAAPPFRQEQGWGGQDVVLMYSGNMGRGHRMGEFLEAARRTREDARLHWVFAGGGKRREEVEAARRESPEARIHLLPYAPFSRLREHLCSADVHLASLASEWQGCMVPSKIQGIFAVGKPVIFVGGRENSLARWIEASGGGWVVAPGDVEGLLAAVSQAMSRDERERRGQAARRYAESAFHRERNVKIMCERLESLGPVRDANGIASAPASHATMSA